MDELGTPLGSGGRGVVAGAALVGGVLSAWLGVLVVVHAGRPVHDLTLTAIVLGVGGALAAIVGWALIARSGDAVLLGAALLGLLLVAGVVSLLSIGIVLLLAGSGVAVVLGRVAGRRRAEGRPVPVRRAIATGALVGVGLPVAALAAADGPVVQCHTNGVSSSESIFRPSSSSSAGGWSGSSGSGTTTMSAEGATGTGMIVQGGRAYRYRCLGDELVEFDATDA